MEILFSDRWLLIVNKPPNLLSIQDGYDKTIPHVRTLLEPEFGRCWIVHRLDKETSGALLLARTKEAHRLVSMLFEKREISKEYKAIIVGKPPDRKFDINLPLRVNGDRRHRTIIDYERGQPAITSIEIISSNRNCSLISVRPITGYTHQIRAHLSHIGFPILGDTLYSLKNSECAINCEFEINRVALHSRSISFFHPFTNEEFSVTASYPLDFSNLLDRLK